MPYRQKITYVASRDMYIVQKGFSARYGKKSFRSINMNETSESQKLINRRLADEKIIYLILENFRERKVDGNKVEQGDRFITLTYKKELRPTTLDEAHEILAKVMKAIKRKYKACKYISKTEMPEGGAVHHHLLITRDVPHDYIAKLWSKYCNRIDDKEIYSLEDFKLANYFVKNEASHKCKEFKYRKSANLTKPKVTVKIIKAHTWKAEPVAKRGYAVVDVQNYFDLFGFEAQRYTMVRRC